MYGLQLFITFLQNYFIANLFFECNFKVTLVSIFKNDYTKLCSLYNHQVIIMLVAS